MARKTAVRRKGASAEIKIHKTFDRTPWTHTYYSGQLTTRPVGHYTIEGVSGYWRLVRNESWDDGKRSIGYFIDFVPEKGDWEQIGGGFGSRAPAWAKVRAVILKDWRSAETAPKKKREK